MRKEYQIELISPFPEESWPMVWGWMEQFRASVMDDFGPQTMEEFVAARLGYEGPEYSWGVLRDGELGGVITFNRVNPVVGFAHSLFRKEFWGRHTTLPALQQAARVIFAEGFLKIVMTPFATNYAIRQLIERLGAQQEGLLKGHTIQNGEPISVVQYALTSAMLDGTPEEMVRCYKCKGQGRIAKENGYASRSTDRRGNKPARGIVGQTESSALQPDLNHVA